MAKDPGISFRWRPGLAALLLAAPAAPCGAAIACERRDVPSLAGCVLSVEGEAAARRIWRWRLAGEDGEGPALQVRGGPAVRFTAPPTRVGGRVRVEAEPEDDPFLRHELILEVVPGEPLAPETPDAFQPGHFAVGLCRFQEEGWTEGGTPRERALAHARRAQEAARACKRRGRAWREAVRVQDLREARARFEGPGPAPPLPAGTGPRNPLKGAFILVLVGCAALENPALAGVLAQTAVLPPPGAPPILDRFETLLQGRLDQLSAACAGSRFPKVAPEPCLPGYSQSVRTDAELVTAEMRQLFVDPEVLGAGTCRWEGTRHKDAKAMLALVQGGQAARYEHLTGLAGALQYKLDRDGALLEVAGLGLLAARYAELAASNATALQTAAFIQGEVGVGLNTVSYGVQALSGLAAALVGQTQAYRWRYQIYANNQTASLLACTQPAEPGAPYPVATLGGVPFASPLPPLQDAYVKLGEACDLARRRLLRLDVCDAFTLEDFRVRNASLSALSVQVPCLSAGVLLGNQGPCPRIPLADSLTRSDTIAWFSLFQAEASAAAGTAFAAANGLFAGGEAIVGAAYALLQAGIPSAANRAFADATLLNAAGTALYANAYDLLAIGSAVRAGTANVVLLFNLEGWNDLQERLLAARSGPAGGSTGVEREEEAGTAPGSTASGSSTGGDGRASVILLPDGTAETTLPETYPAAPVTSGALRARGLPFAVFFERR